MLVHKLNLNCTGSTTDVPIGDVSGVENRAAGSFLVGASDITCKAVALRFGTTVGTPTGTFTVQIQTDNSGVPSGTLAHANATTTGTPTGGQGTKFTFTNTFTLTAATRYWVVPVISNQTTNNRWALRCTTSGLSPTFGAASSTDGGVTWTNQDATYDGFVKVYTEEEEALCVSYSDDYSNAGSNFVLNSTAKRVYQTWDCPTGVNNVSNIKMWLAKTGSPTGNVNCGIYATDGAIKPTGSSLGSATVANSSIGSGAEYTFTFSTPVVVTPGTKYCFVMSIDNGDASNYVNTYNNNPITNTNVGTNLSGYSSNSGSTWSTSTYQQYHKVYYTAFSSWWLKQMANNVFNSIHMRH